MDMRPRRSEMAETPKKKVARPARRRKPKAEGTVEQPKPEGARAEEPRPEPTPASGTAPAAEAPTPAQTPAPETGFMNGGTASAVEQLMKTDSFRARVIGLIVKKMK
jgi:outer membrane biosynthesis protein TonB